MIAPPAPTYTICNKIVRFDVTVIEEVRGMIKKIAFIGHHVRDMARAEHFYGELLGLAKTADYEGKWCEFDTPDGKTIALEAFSPEGTPPYLALETDDIEAEIARLKGLQDGDRQGQRG